MERNGTGTGTGTGTTNAKCSSAKATATASGSGSGTGTARSRRSVHFSNEVRCKPIRYKTPAELRSVWYSSDERTELQGRAKKVVKRLRRRAMSEEELLASKNESMRGVEHLLSSATLREMQQEQRDVVDAVVLLQEHWRLKGLPFDAGELAYTSRALSASARERARHLGKADAKEMEEAEAALSSVTTPAASVVGCATCTVEGAEADTRNTDQQTDADGSELLQTLQI